MQFELTYIAGQDQATLKFSSKNNPYLFKSLFDSVKRIGGVCNGNMMNAWTIPSFITSQVISEIIRNTCFKCGGLMKDSTALQNTLVSSNDFGNDAGQRGTTQSRVGPAKQITVRKCSSCGHSHT